MKAWRFILGPIAVLVFLMTLLTGCGQNNSQSIDKLQQVQVMRGDLIQKVSGSGKVTLVTDSKLSFSSGGRLTALNIKEGERVTSGEVLAKLDTSAMEVSLAQAKTGQDQAHLALAQAQAALNQANISKLQAQSALTAAQFNLDKIQAVGELRNKIEDIESEITTVIENKRLALATGDSESVSYLNIRLKELNLDYQYKFADLMQLMGKSEYSGVGSYLLTYDSSTGTYSLDGNSYSKLAVEEIQIKELAVEAAQKTVDQAENGITIAQKSLDQVNDSIEQAQKSLDYIQKQIDDATMTAPFNGIVAALFYDQGDYIPSPAYTPQYVIYLVDTEHLEVAAAVNQMDIPWIKVGQTTDVSVDSLPGVSIQGQVTSISSVADKQAAAAGSTDYVVKAAFNVPQGQVVKVDMNAKVEITTFEHQNVLWLPVEAVKQDSQGQSYVQVIKDQSVVSLSVVTGMVSGTKVEIVSGLTEGDKVVNGTVWSVQ
jgi:HlyD family secretion protein